MWCRIVKCKSHLSNGLFSFKALLHSLINLSRTTLTFSLLSSIPCRSASTIKLQTPFISILHPVLCPWWPLSGCRFLKNVISRISKIVHSTKTRTVITREKEMYALHYQVDISLVVHQKKCIKNIIN